MATINFLFRSTKEEAPLTVRLLFRNNNTDYVFATNTQYVVTKHYWTKQHDIKKPKELTVVNKQHEVTEEINKIEKHVLTAFNSVSIGVVNKEWLQNQIGLYYNPPVPAEQLPNDLIGYFDKYLEFKKNEITPNTKKKINVIKQLLIRYVDYTKKPLNLTDVDGNFKMSFEAYCLENLYAPNTIATALKFIKTICNHAKSYGLDISVQLSNIKIKQTKVDSVYLTFDDLDKIEKTDKTKFTDSLLNARDWLIISCYTGQRISDFMRFTDKQIRVENGKSLLEFTQVKTGKNMTVPLHKKVLEILKKRKGKFPYAISDQKYNAYIKKVCEIAEIEEQVSGSKKSETEEDSGIYRKETGTFKKWELVTSHIGRRSFATNFYGKIPTTYLIYVTGHSTETMFLTYIGKSNKDLAMELVNYF
ncbi:tyrosine-type recombinase/integrase [Flavobacterium sp. XS2P24]|uniref:phage integrase SAM-like domain-containing protein n=1 Tax=Flavobacterium sp. XS2P24 TaxID=3041249 RepID=UPI0024A7E968|nr:tyrosine-type recombinase/integrase [Flavobacterium sp. XS2P24]MDI6050642.1 tyrosine-type recombinase/integrase [Flavobacterium sp. XS2P24]